MNFETMRSTRESLDVVGVGFGPSNLALAIAINEHNARGIGDPLTARFVERHPRFGWHRGMLVDFINYGSAFPTRVEFHDYLEWAASIFAAYVDYGTEVIGIEPVDGGGSVECFEVVTHRPDVGTARLRARNVVFAVGLRPHLLEGAGARIWYSCDSLPEAAALTAPERLTVVGAGQSATEAVDYLHRTFPSAEVRVVFPRYGYGPADDTSSPTGCSTPVLWTPSSVPRARSRI